MPLLGLFLVAPSARKIGASGLHVTLAVVPVHRDRQVSVPHEPVTNTLDMISLHKT
jgi:hypothetical protein